MKAMLFALFIALLMAGYENAKSTMIDLDKQDAPTLLVHGSRDPRVPLKLSEQMFAELKKREVPAKLVVIEGAGHGFTGKDAKRASSERVAWFDKHLLGE